MQKESPRTCKICGGPNHHGCGCEAKQRRTVGMVENKDLKTAEQPASEDEILEKVFSAEAIEESDRVNKEMAKGIKTIADSFETLCAATYDTNNYLKVIASDLITIRKYLTQEDAAEKINLLSVISYLSNIDQQLKEINARGQNASKNQN